MNCWRMDEAVDDGCCISSPGIDVGGRKDGQHRKGERVLYLRFPSHEE